MRAATAPGRHSARLRLCRFRGLIVASIALVVATGSVIGAAPVFAVTSPPKITSFTPISGPAGTSVTVQGSNYIGTTAVAFNNAAASFTVVSATQISATVPSGARTGPISVTTPGGLAISSSNFTLTTAAPTLTVSPDAGPPGSTIAVTGANFSTSVAVDVYFDTTDEALAATSSSGAFSVSITVPKSAVPGNHWVSGVERGTQLAAQAAFSVQTNWSQFHNTAKRRGSNTTENVLNPGNVSGIDADWSATTGSAVVSAPAVAGGVVYVGSYDHNVYATTAAGGTPLWSYTTGDRVASSPAVADGVVYVGSFDANVYALSAASGTLLWSYTTGGAVYSSPAVANGVVYVGSSDDRIYALNAATGGLIWSYLAASAVSSSPAVANGVVFVGSNDGNVSALSAASGTLIWSYSDGGFYVQSSPAVANGVVYVGTTDGKVDALRAATGALLWSDTTGGYVTSSPAVANGVVYIGSSDSKVYALNAVTGGAIWTYLTGNRVLSSPAVANGVVYIGSNDDRLYALNASTGGLLWSYLTGDFVGSSPAVADGVVYVGSNDFKIYAFDLAGGTSSVMRPVPAHLKPDHSLRLQPSR